jgi:hypothetical protein
MSSFLVAAMGLVSLIAILFVLPFALTTGQPVLWVVTALLLALGLFLLQQSNRMQIETNIANNLQMAKNLVALADDFEDLQDTYLTRKPDEVVFYELAGVQLLEYKSSGSDFKSTYLGGNVRVADGLSISLGGSKGKLVSTPEESTTIDTGKATFTNKRVIFAGSNHSREWDLEKLIGLDIGIAGFVVTPAVSNRTKLSALAGGAQLGITPGVLFAMSVEYFQNGKKAAQDFARETAQGVFDQLSAMNRPIS